MPARALRRIVLIAPLAGLALTTGCGDSRERDTSDADSTTSAAAPVAAASDVGAQRYLQVCQTCHMANGEGQTGNIPPLAGSEWVAGDPRAVIAIALHGLQGPITVKGASYDAVMQPWGMFPDDELAAVLTHVRSNFGNSASPITAAQVAEVRAAEGTRGAWTAAELKAKFGTK